MPSIPDSLGDYRLQWVEQIRQPEFLADWESGSQFQEGPMDADYLAALERAQPRDLQFFYGMLYHRDANKPVARVVLQVLNFSQRNFRFRQHDWKTLLALLALRLRRFRVVMAGNLFSVGKPLIECADPQHLPALLEAIEQKAQSMQYDLLLLKDLPEQWSEIEFTSRGFSPFEADLTMQLELPADWKTFDDYTQALSKKYRQRLVRVRKAGAGLERTWIPAEALLSFSHVIETLFRAVQHRQVVRMGVIDSRYFLELSHALGERFRMLGYFLEGKLVGFASYIQHADELEVHYIGMDYSINASHQLYFNILFDGIERAIQERFSKLELGRTAREAKAVCGCEPRHFRDRYKTRKPRVQQLLNKMAASFSEDEGTGWKNRHPFRPRAS